MRQKGKVNSAGHSQRLFWYPKIRRPPIIACTDAVCLVNCLTKMTDAKVQKFGAQTPKIFDLHVQNLGLPPSQSQSTDIRPMRNGLASCVVLAFVAMVFVSAHTIVT